ncbi:MAG: methyltransferase domain-containing protein, partial [Gammaproteobacteria bacterium]
MLRISLLLFMVFIGACATAPQAIDVAELDAVLTDNPGRPQADKDRDLDRRPAEVLRFLGVERGMTAVDLVAAAGYYTEVLSHGVGPGGRVYMQNSPQSLSGNRGERTAEAIAERLANNRLANVEQLVVPPDNLTLPPNSVDVAIIALEFHEFYRAADPAAAANFLAEMRRVLKPGGVLGIIDHAGSPVFDPGPLHRALESRVVADAQAAGL